MPLLEQATRKTCGPPLSSVALEDTAENVRLLRTRFSVGDYDSLCHGVTRTVGDLCEFAAVGTRSEVGIPTWWESEVGILRRAKLELRALSGEARLCPGSGPAVARQWPGSGPAMLWGGPAVAWQ